MTREYLAGGNVHTESEEAGVKDTYRQHDNHIIRETLRHRQDEEQTIV